MEVSFSYFLWRDRRNRMILITAAISIIVQLGLFKYFYPYASFIYGDSFSYLDAAINNSSINTYMVGYSKFLRLFSAFTSSDTALVCFQYLFIQWSALYLLFTVFYFYKLSNVTQYILLAFMVFNPLFLHLANTVSSDCFFAALSLSWFSLLLWIIHRPTTKILFLQALILFIAFTVRYNALIYPIIAIVAFCLSSLSLEKKIFGICFGLVLCGLFVFNTSYEYKKLTGYRQYSPFSGWQLTNNAMYAYRHVDSVNRKTVPNRFLTFDNSVRAFFDSTRDLKKFPTEAQMASTYYMWSPGMPMMDYKDSLYKKDTAVTDLKKWALMGPFYKSYGIYIIKKYPWHFMRYFIWPNAKKYYAPPVEFMTAYNTGHNLVTDETKEWFKYKTNKVKTRMKSYRVQILDFYPILTGIINVVMFFGLMFYIILKGWKMDAINKKGIILSSVVWLLNAAFTIVASSVALRFQSFPIIVTSVFVANLLDWLWSVAMNRKVETSKADRQELVLNI